MTAQPTQRTDAAPRAARAKGRPMRRPSVNLTSAERAVRILTGTLGVIVGALLLASAGAAWVVALEVLLVLAGLDLIVTGARGHCPLYRALGYVPPSPRRST